MEYGDYAILIADLVATKHDPSLVFMEIGGHFAVFDVAKCEDSSEVDRLSGFARLSLLRVTLQTES